jgi:hypothetical protein
VRDCVRPLRRTARRGRQCQRRRVGVRDLPGGVRLSWQEDAKPIVLRPQLSIQLLWRRTSNRRRWIRCACRPTAGGAGRRARAGLVGAQVSSGHHHVDGTWDLEPAEEHAGVGALLAAAGVIRGVARSERLDVDAEQTRDGAPGVDQLVVACADLADRLVGGTGGLGPDCVADLDPARGRRLVRFTTVRPPLIQDRKCVLMCVHGDLRSPQMQETCGCAPGPVNR